MNKQVTLQNGMDVYGADDAKLGSIHDVRNSYFVVEKGFFFPKDYYIPVTAIEGIDSSDRVYLNVTKDVALNQGWDELPENQYDTDNGYATSGTAAAGTVAGAAAGSIAGKTRAAADQTATGKTVTNGQTMANGTMESKTASAATGNRAGDPTQARSGSSEVISPDYVAASDKAASGAEATRVPVYEEEITPVKRAVDRGAVRIEKEVVTENRTITVPVTEERVRVTRVDANEPVSATSGDLFKDGVIEVPLHGEEVDVQKTAHKTGEVVVEKEAVQRDEQVSGTIRRENVRVDDKTVQSSKTPIRKSA